MDEIFDNVKDNTAVIMMLGVLSSKLTQIIDMLSSIEEKLVEKDKNKNLYS